MHSFSSFLRIPLLFLALVAFAPLEAQINISLHPTAVPDSFEVRMHAIAPQTLGVLSGVFTLRWDAAAGGVINASDIRSTCTAYTFNRLAGHPTTQGDYRYCTIIIDGRWALNDCPFTTEPRVIGTVRIRQLTGCRRVAIVNDPYAMANNAIYYVSAGGVPQTGAITSQPLTSGDCAPCTAPSITSISGQHHISCEAGPLELSSTTTGGPMIYSWTAPENYGPYPASFPVAWTPNATLPFAVLGQYTLTVSNACGSNAESLTIVMDTVCIPPVITSISQTPPQPPNAHHHFLATATGTCLAFHWTGLNVAPAYQWETWAPNAAGTYAVVVSNACGSDTASVFVEFDTTNCNPPQINALTYSNEVCAGMPFSLDASLSAGTPDLQYVWTGPTEVPDGWAHVIVPNAITGTYQLVVTNPCGSDTASLQVDVIACLPPELLNISQSGFNCSQPLHLQATMNNASCVQITWSGPVDIASTSMTASIPNAVPGTYELIASNTCGSDTAQVVVQIGPSPPAPNILGITSNGPVCEGDTLVLTATVNDPNADFSWKAYNYTAPMLHLPDTTAVATVAHAPYGYYYQLVITNECGQYVRTCTIDVVSNESNPAPLCSPVTAPFPLQNRLLWHTPGGTWTFNGSAHDGVYHPGIDSQGTYYYHDALGCAPVPVHLIELGPQENGTNGSTTLCGTDPPVGLFQFIGGSPGTLGTWVYGLDNVFNGTYDPAVNYGTTYRYFAFCATGSPALVTVTEVLATLWYQDLDNDGFGDSGASVLDCAPEGYVSDSADDCPNIFGLIGDACDDGLDYTDDDVITSECVCEGELGTGITEAGVNGFRIWPNPTDGDAFFFTLADMSGTARITLTDVAGKRVMERMVQLNAEFSRVPLHADIARGLYLVRVMAGDQLYTAPLTVR